MIALYRVDVIRHLRRGERKHGAISYLIMAGSPLEARMAVAKYDADIEGQEPYSVSKPTEMGDGPVMWNHYTVAKPKGDQNVS